MATRAARSQRVKWLVLFMADSETLQRPTLRPFFYIASSK